MNSYYEGLKPYCNTDRQIQVITMRASGMTTKDVSEVLVVTERTIQRIARLVIDRAKIRGYAPEYDMTHAVP